MKITQQTQDWGNSTGVRLPKKVLQTVKWQHNQMFTIDVQGKSLILTPVQSDASAAPSLEELLAGVTPDMIHEKIEWGIDRGKEVIND